MSRVESLASCDVDTESQMDEFGVRWIKDKEGRRPSYAMLVPLLEIIAEARGMGVGTKTVMVAYEQLIGPFGNEFNVLLKTPLKELQNVADEKVVEGISKVRSGDIVIEPGYDGVFGKVKIWKEGETEEKGDIDQTTLF